VPKDAEGVSQIKDIASNVGVAKNTNLVQKSFNKLAAHDLTMFDNPAARSVLATALDEGHANHLGILVAGTGGSITMPSGASHIIDQLLENNAVPKKYQREVKDFVVDYYSMKDKLITLQMGIQGNKLGRTMLPLIQALYAQLPGPTTADSTMAKRQLANLQEFASGVKSHFPDTYGSYKKEPDYEFPKEPKSSRLRESVPGA
jgi:hypothetical protein